MCVKRRERTGVTSLRAEGHGLGLSVRPLWSRDGPRSERCDPCEWRMWLLLLLLLLLLPPCSGLHRDFSADAVRPQTGSRRRPLCADPDLPAPPQKLRMSSENFRHVLHWSAAEDAAPGITYLVYHRCQSKRPKKLVSSSETWAVLLLSQPKDSYSLCVQSLQDQNYSCFSKHLSFTPFMHTNITAPRVTLSGGNMSIYMNISLPEVHESSGFKNIRDLYYDLCFYVSLQRKNQAVVFIATSQQTLLVPNLLPGTEYCVQVQPRHLDIHFQPSPLKCVSTNPAPSSVFVAVVSGAVGLVSCLLVLFLVLWGLRYTGIICKLKHALPLPLMNVLKQHSPMMREPDPREPLSPVCLLPHPQSCQHQSWSHLQDQKQDQKQDHKQDQKQDQKQDHKQDQKQDLYLSRGADLSADSILRCGQTVLSQSGSPTTGMDQEEEEEKEEEDEDEEEEEEDQEEKVPQASVGVNPVDRVDSVDSVDLVDSVNHVDSVHSLDHVGLIDWGSEQDCVDLLSVTVSTLDDEPSSFCQTLLPQPDSDTDLDTAPPQPEWNDYMDRQI